MSSLSYILESNEAVDILEPILFQLNLLCGDSSKDWER